MKNILMLCCSGGKGGAGISAKELIQVLCKNCNIHAFAENDFVLENFRKIENSNLTVYSSEKGRGLKNIVKNTFSIKKIIKEQNIDLIITNTNKDALYSALLNIFFIKTPRLIFVHDFQWINKKIIWLLNPKSIILIPSKALLEKNNYIPNWNTVVVPNFISAQDKEQTKFPKAPTILCLAHFSKWKGISYLLKSFAIAKNSVPDLKLILAGEFFEKNYELEIITEAKSLYLENSIEFKPFIDDVSKYYNEASFVVNSSISEFGGPETFGRTIIESWSFAKPVVSFACGGPKYIIENGVDGFLVPEKNVEAMAEKFILLAQNGELAKNMGMMGLKKVKEKYSGKAIFEQLEKLMNGVRNA